MPCLFNIKKKTYINNIRVSKYKVFVYVKSNVPPKNLGFAVFCKGNANSPQAYRDVTCCEHELGLVNMSDLYVQESFWIPS